MQLVTYKLKAVNAMSRINGGNTSDAVCKDLADVSLYIGLTGGKIIFCHSTLDITTDKRDSYASYSIKYSEMLRKP